MNKLNFDTVRKMGHFDGANRFYLDPEFITDTSRAVRTPSRAWPYSILKHAMTCKYYKSLSEAQLKLIGAL